MTIEELIELRDKVISCHAEFKKLNDEYNEMLFNERNNQPKGKNRNQLEKELLKKLLGYALIEFFLLFLLFSFPSLAIIVLFAGIISLKTIDKTIKKYDREIQGKGAVHSDEPHKDELYEKLSEVREKYFTLKKDFESKVSVNNLELSEEYQEYLRMLDSYIEECVSTSELDISDEAKTLNLKSKVQ